MNGENELKMVTGEKIENMWSKKREKKIHLCTCAIVHVDQVVLSCHLLKARPVLPLIFCLLQEPEGKKTRRQLKKIKINSMWWPLWTVGRLSHFFLKRSLAFSRSPPYDVRLDWPFLPTGWQQRVCLRKQNKQTKKQSTIRHPPLPHLIHTLNTLAASSWSSWIR